jgi:hypothetical protein
LSHQFLLGEVRSLSLLSPTSRVALPLHYWQVWCTLYSGSPGPTNVGEQEMYMSGLHSTATSPRWALDLTNDIENRYRLLFHNSNRISPVSISEWHDAQGFWYGVALNSHAATTTFRTNLSPFTKNCRVVIALNATSTNVWGAPAPTLFSAGTSMVHSIGGTVLVGQAGSDP